MLPAAGLGDRGAGACRGGGRSRRGAWVQPRSELADIAAVADLAFTTKALPSTSTVCSQIPEAAGFSAFATGCAFPPAAVAPKRRRICGGSQGI